MTIGEFLRKLREEKRISLEEAANGTNIRLLYLQALEDDRLDQLPSQAQARGFVRLYAAYLGIDARDVFEEVERINNPPVEVKPLSPLEPTDSPTSDLTEESATHSNSVATTARKKNRKVHKPDPVENKPDEKKNKDASVAQVIFTQIGSELRAQREALGLSLTDVERLTKIREFFLYSLENGQIDDLPSSVQGRGMLNNYAAFLSLNAESLQMRYAEGLQQRRQEQFKDDVTTRKSGVKVMGREPLTGWRRFLTPDLLVGSTVFIALFALVIWGATQMIRTSALNAEPTISSISDILVGEGTLTAGPPEEATMQSDVPATNPPESIITPVVDLQATLSAGNFGPIQLVVVAYQRAYMRVTVDGKETFTGRVVPGNVYSYSGSNKISLLTGNAAALQVYYNQQNLGVLGPYGQVVEMEFTLQEMMTPTPRFTATPTLTPRPTLTALPTRTPPPTIAPPTMTITPVRTLAP